jgi:hypothetical protein
VLASAAAAEEPIRIATFHTELERDGPGLLLRDILKREPDVLAAARLIGAAQADLIVLQGFDYDRDLVALDAFADLVEDFGISYPQRFAWRPNTGRPSGQDLDGDGRLGGPGDALGYGDFAGQGGMAILTKLPIQSGESRDLSNLAWSSLPDTLYRISDGPDRPVSTRAHWDLAVQTPSGADFRLWTYHATAPVFDGPEDMNGRRNHDETALWLARVDVARAPIVIAADLNIDPNRGEGRRSAIHALLTHPSLQDTDSQNTPTADWPDHPKGPGDLRVSYVLPSRDWTVLAAGQMRAERPPDGDGPRHALVWADLILAH